MPRAGMILNFSTPDRGEISPVITRLILSGFAGRNTAEVEHHIAEMARQGVPRPARVPTFWPVLPHLLSQGGDVAVYGGETTPEVEYVLFTWGGTTYVTLGNDQCDIEVEAKLSAEKSKNLCPKTVAATAWPVNDVLAHWDQLELSITCNGVALQQDRLAALIRPETLLEKVAAIDGSSREGCMVFSGTIGTIGQLPPPPYDVAMRLYDPVLGREISHGFRVTALRSFEGHSAH